MFWRKVRSVTPLMDTRLTGFSEDFKYFSSVFVFLRSHEHTLASVNQIKGDRDLLLCHYVEEWQVYRQQPLLIKPQIKMTF